MTVEVGRVGADAAEVVHGVIARAFGSRAPLDPPAAALAETPETVAAALAGNGGLLASLDGRPLGCLVFGPERDRALMLTRFGVVPEAQGTGVAGALVAHAAAEARARGHAGMRVVARAELPASLAFWEHHGFVRTGRDGVNVTMLRIFDRRIEMPTAEVADELGRRLAEVVRAGDLLILSGELGAGKTTLTRGIGAGLEVRGDVTSPTFVIARVHPPTGSGPALVHVDAYRLGGIDELDDLDLDTSLSEAVTVVEWGEGVAEGLADDRLEIRIVRALGAVAPAPGASAATGEESLDPRELWLQPVGERWLDADLDKLDLPL